MADVRERGQLILVAGFTLAVMFVTVALLLNTAIFAENLATRTTGGQSLEASSAADAVDGGLRTGIKHINLNNENNASYADLTRNLTGMTTNWSDASNRQLSIDGSRVHVSVLGTANGSRLLHENTSRNWTAGGTNVGQPEWTLFDDVEADNVQWFYMNISRKALFTASTDTTMAATADSAFNPRIVNQTGAEWRVYIFEGAATDSIYVLVEDPGEDFRNSPKAYTAFAQESCIVTAVEGQVHFQLWEGDINGIRCQHLDFVHDLDGPVSVEFENTTSEHPITSNVSARVKGKYDIMVNTTDVKWSNFHPARDDLSPFALTAITKVDYRQQYRQAAVTYTTRSEIVPRFVGGVTVDDDPRLGVSVNDTSGLLDTVDFDIAWDARDVNDDLDWVNVTVRDKDGNVVETYDNDVSGGTASGTEEFIRTSDNGPYEFTVIVTDLDGNSDTVTQTHAADGDGEGDPP